MWLLATYNIHMKQLGNRLIELREARGLTRAQAAQQLHISIQTLTRWERGLSKRGIIYLTKFVRFYGVTYEYLLD